MNSLSNTEHESFNNQESADFLFHFTQKIESLTNILQKKYFMPFYCLESLEYLNIPELKIAGMAYPVVCFCDLPLSRHKEHKSKFGEYGIGMKREWGRKNYLTAVVYTYANCFTSASLRSFITLSELLKVKLTKKEFNEFNKAVSFLMMHYKPFEGKQYDKDNKEFARNLTRFYDEREWRYIPLKVDKLLLSLTMDEYQTKEILDKENEKIQKNNKLDFELTDIEYLFLKSMDEIDNFLSSMRPNYSEEQIVEIKKKIQLF